VAWTILLVLPAPTSPRACGTAAPDRGNKDRSGSGSARHGASGNRPPGERFTWAANRARPATAPRSAVHAARSVRSGGRARRCAGPQRPVITSMAMLWRSAAGVCTPSIRIDAAYSPTHHRCHCIRVYARSRF
jgi:hypothetical protein